MRLPCVKLPRMPAWLRSPEPSPAPLAKARICGAGQRPSPTNKESASNATDSAPVIYPRKGTDSRFHRDSYRDVSRASMRGVARVLGISRNTLADWMKKASQTSPLRKTLLPVEPVVVFQVRVDARGLHPALPLALQYGESDSLSAKCQATVKKPLPKTAPLPRLPLP